jgi:hypothetical protein
MNIPECALRVFSTFSKLYPQEYRRRYSEELISVFLDMLEDSDKPGGWRAVRCLLRECACLPVCLIREYLSAFQGGSMKSTAQILAATISGFLALFFLDGVERGLSLVVFGPAYRSQPGVLPMTLTLNGLVAFSWRAESSASPFP